MADIFQINPNQFSVDDQVDEIQPQFRDNQFILLVVLAIISLVTAVVIGIFTRFFSAGILSLSGIQTLVILQAVFGVLAIGLYIAAVWHIRHNNSLLPQVGCPSCQNLGLMRISRRRRDRLLTFAGIRVARYQCRECRWTGPRIYKGEYLLLPGRNSENLDVAYAQPMTVPASWPVKSRSATDEAVVETENPTTGIGVHDSSDLGSFGAKELGLSALSIFALSSDASPDDETTPKTLEEEVKNVVLGSKSESSDEGETIILTGSDTAKVLTTFGINLKLEPYADSKWVGLLGPKTLVTLHECKKYADGTSWFLVQHKEQSGWIESSNLDPIL